MRATCAGGVRVWTLVSTAGILLFLAHPAHADKGGPDERLVIFPMTTESTDLPADLPTSLTRVLHKVASGRGMKATVLQVSLEDTALMAGCVSAENVACHELVLGQLDADSGMTSEVETTGAGKVKVTVHYFDGKTSPTRRSFEVSQENAASELEGALPALFGDPVAPTFEGNLGPAPSDRRFDVSRVKKSSWFVLGGGGALMGVGTIFWLTASLEQGRIDDAPVETAADLDRLADLEGSARTRATVGNVLFFSGLAVATLGGILAVHQALASESGAPAASPPAAAGIRFAPALMPGGAGIFFSMEWQ